MTTIPVSPIKRIILVHWKHKSENKFEIFSNLKNFCLSYKNYSYNTLNNYLSKAKTAFDNEDVRVDRLQVILKPKRPKEGDWKRKIVPVIRRTNLKEADDEIRDHAFWMTKTPSERMYAVKSLNSQFYPTKKRMDKTKLVKRKMKA